MKAMFATIIMTPKVIIPKKIAMPPWTKTAIANIQGRVQRFQINVE
jgi:hypothetical protein